MDIETLKQEMAKLRAPTPDISEAEMSKTPLPPDNREKLRAELVAAQRRDAQEPRKVVRCSDLLGSVGLERRVASGENSGLVGVGGEPPLDAIDDMRQNPSRFLRRAAEIMGVDKCEHCKKELSSVEIDRGLRVCGQCRADIAEASDEAPADKGGSDGN